MYCLIRQLPKLFQHLGTELDSKNQMLKDPSFEALWPIFMQMVADSGKNVICVLDGLDQVDHASLENIVSSLSNLVIESASNASQSTAARSCFKVVLTTRPLPKVVLAILDQFPRISLERNSPRVKIHMESDVEIFVQDKFEVYFPSSYLTKYFESPTQQNEWCRKTKAKLVEKADGTFLWASYTMKRLKKVDAHNVGKELDKFPKGLEGIYSHILLQIQNTYEEEQKQQIAAVLQLVVIAVQPLSLTEIAVAINIEKQEGFRLDGIIESIVNNCEGLLILTKDGTVSPMHQSVRDYLLSRDFDKNSLQNRFRVTETLAHAKVARTCIHYLQLGSLANGPVVEGRHPWEWQLIPTRRVSFPLLSYSILNWPTHARLSCTDIFDDKDLFSFKNSDPRDAWLNAYWYLTAHLSGRLSHPPKMFSALHMAAFCDLPVLATRLLKGHWPLIHSFSRIDIKDTHKRTPLWYASRNGKSDIVELLLKKGAALDGKNDHGQTALWQAAAGGHKDVVELLVRKGAHIDAKNCFGETPLWQAAKEGHKEVVELLVKRGAAVDARSAGYGETPLWQAAAGGFKDVVEFLLSQGAEVDAEDHEYRRTPLVQAAPAGHIAIVELLLRNHATIDAKNKFKRTALSQAAVTGHVAIVKLLLEKGAMAENKDIYGQTPLWEASLRGHSEVVALLLQEGAIVDMKNTFGCPLLTQTVRNNRIAVVKLLLERGAFIEIRDDASDETPLCVAAKEGNLDMVNLLLEHGAVVNFKALSGYTPLMCAAEWGRTAVVKLLLEKGAAVDNDPTGCTPLWLAKTKGHTDVVEVLVKHAFTNDNKGSAGEPKLSQAPA